MPRGGHDPADVILDSLLVFLRVHQVWLRDRDGSVVSARMELAVCREDRVSCDDLSTVRGHASGELAG